MSVKIVIDSASDISKAEAEKLGVVMIPMEITIGSEEIYDGVDLLPEQFYEKLIESDDLPKTSQITSFRFGEVFERIVKEGNEVVAITISSKLSGTFAGAMQAAEKKVSDRG